MMNSRISPINVETTNAKKNTNKRFLLYDPGCIGMGHSRRCASIAKALVSSSDLDDPAQVMILTGYENMGSLLNNGGKDFLLRNIDFIRLPNYRRDPTFTSNMKLSGQCVESGPWKDYYSQHLEFPTGECGLRKHCEGKVEGKGAEIEDFGTLKTLKAKSGLKLSALRSQIIQSAILSFSPDVILVDFEPLGVRGELVKPFRVTRTILPDCRIVLGLRDVLDDTAKFRGEWEAKGVFDHLDKLYDGVMVYGDRTVHNPLDGLIPKTMCLEINFVGMLGTERKRKKAPRELTLVPAPLAGTKQEEEDSLPLVKGEFVLVTGGGGRDAAHVYDWVIRVYEEAEVDESFSQELPPSLIVLGPFLPCTFRSQFHRRACAVNAKAGSTQIVIVDKTDRMEHLMTASLGLVAMGGCNTMTEILKLNIKAVCVPRVDTRKEQTIRADLFLKKGLLSAVLTPTDQCKMGNDEFLPTASANPTKLMTNAIVSLKTQKTPAEVFGAQTLARLVSGLYRVPEALGAVEFDDASSVQSAGSATTTGVLQAIWDSTSIPEEDNKRAERVIRTILDVRHHTLADRFERIRELSFMGDFGIETMVRFLVRLPRVMQIKNGWLFRYELLYFLVRRNRVSTTFTRRIMNAMTASVIDVDDQDITTGKPIELQSTYPGIEGTAWPHFMILGASKCGTSSLARYLLAEPSFVFQSRAGGAITLDDAECRDMGKWDTLEVHSFDVRAFSEDFMTKRNEMVTPTQQNLEDALLGSVTPHYLFHPLVPFRLAKMIPLGFAAKMKFVVVLRDPVERAMSSFWFKKGVEVEKQGAEESLTAGMRRRVLYEKKVRKILNVSDGDASVCCIGDVKSRPSRKNWEAYLDALYFSSAKGVVKKNLFVEHIGKGIYYEQLKRWFAIFPRKNFFICTLEDMKANGARMLEDVIRFVCPEKAEITIDSEWRKRAIERMKLCYNSTPVKGEIPSDLETRLREFYRPYNKKLSELLGRSFWGGFETDGDEDEK